MGCPIELVMFDLDGTLLDHRGAVAAALSRWVPARGGACGAEVVAAWLAAEDRHFPEWRAGRISLAEQRRRRLREVMVLWGEDVGDDDLLDVAFAEYLEHFEASWRAFGDVGPVIDGLVDAGLRVAVLTNGETRQQLAKLRAVGLSDRFGDVLTAGGLGVWKPDPAIFHAACARLDVAPSGAVHVGDDYELDVLAPRKVGMHSIHVDRTGAGPLDEPWRIESLEGLLAAIVDLRPEGE